MDNGYTLIFVIAAGFGAYLLSKKEVFIAHLFARYMLVGAFVLGVFLLSPLTRRVKKRDFGDNP